MELYRHAHDFCATRQGKDMLKALRHMLKEQEGREKYLSGEREFRKRVD